ncbi:hypothetical protein AALP_AA1G290600 [Arabis alpina]|uniref:Uncharacterized protein n=1 Tax=Arabis alpina TaxID=50452 RepID=A0A087HRD7_ARAAL|nr:hypothetical protein AALP_AA1G290600 [Arabis alpina]
MGHVNISKLARLLVKLHKSPSGWLCVHPKLNRSSSNDKQQRSKLIRSDDFFKNDLTFLTIASMKANGVKKSVVTTTKQPFLIQKGEKTGERLRIRVSEDFMSELMIEGREEEEEDGEGEGEGEGEGRVCNTVKLKKDYVQLVGLRKWKPKLETITETKAMVEKRKKKKRKRFSVMKKKNQTTDLVSKRKVQSKFIKSKSVSK